MKLMKVEDIDALIDTLAAEIADDDRRAEDAALRMLEATEASPAARARADYAAADQMISAKERDRVRLVRARKAAYRGDI